MSRTEHKLAVAGGWHVSLEFLQAQLENHTSLPFWATHTKETGIRTTS
jgi:hypothetical protein